MNSQSDRKKFILITGTLKGIVLIKNNPDLKENAPNQTILGLQI